MPASLTMTTPPAGLPVPLALAKSQCRVTHDAEDALIAHALRTAAADAGAECGYGLGVAEYTLTLDDFPPGHGADGRGPWWWPLADLRAYPPSGCTTIQLPVRPVVSVTAVRYYDADGTLTTLDPSAYWLGASTGRLAPAAGYWPCPQYGRPEAITIEFTAGLEPSEIPPQARQAVLLIAADRYAHRGDGDADRAVPDAAVRLLRQVHPGTYFG